jgi:tungstate transport system substrate-binding protein
MKGAVRSDQWKFAVFACVSTFLLYAVGSLHAEGSAEPGRKVVRAAVIGGMTMTGLWPEIARRFEKHTSYSVEVVATGPRPGLAKAMRRGKVDLLTMHSGDITTNLVADGYARNMRPWTKNDLVLVGPSDDPAEVKGMANAVRAFRRLARRDAAFVDFRGIGTREMAHKMWRLAGVPHGYPAEPWLVEDQCEDHRRILHYALRHDAYVVVGRMPILFGRMPKPDGMEIMVQDDPRMRRPYVVMEAHPGRFSEANVKGARALADFLLSRQIQTFLQEFGAEKYSGIPLFHPVSRKLWTNR